jgi:transcriptional regulator with XRE-family HTH domain
MAAELVEPDPQWAAWRAAMDRRGAELVRARAARAARRAAAIEEQRAAGEQLRAATVDVVEVDALVGLLRAAVGASLRAGRRRRCLSQRELARLLGVSPSTVARLEAGSGQPRLAEVVRALAAVGGRLVLERPVRPTRMSGEYVRDQAGRRLPAHLEQYCLDAPHTWWPGTTDSRYWDREPTWSYQRRHRAAGDSGGDSGDDG